MAMLTEHRVPPISVIDFKAGDLVIWIPSHAHGDARHQDCEQGWVASINDKYVFVRFGRNSGNGEACDPRQLVKQEGT